MSKTTVSTHWRAFAAVILVSATMATDSPNSRADLDTAGAASLEWQVDSADAIFLAEVVGDDRILKTSDEILRRVKERIALNMPLPIDCDPDLTDHLYRDRVDRLPVAKWLSLITSQPYRLPIEAEWEKACGGGYFWREKQPWIRP